MGLQAFVQYPGSFSLIVVTVIISLIAFARESLWRYLALEPYRMAVTHQYHQIITSGFVHANMAHLIVNMMTLYFIGRALEETVGGELFLVIYFVSLVTGSLYPFLKYRKTPEYVAIGASGAISGVLFSFCLFYPLEKIYIFFALPMPAILFAVLYVGYSIFSMRSRNDNIGHEAHLAGALGGVIVTLVAFPQVIANLGSRLAP
jgi:membrane associated rhomboid family serine protease